MSAIDEFQYLWDGSEPGWKLQCIEHTMWCVTFRFGKDGPSKSQVAAIRNLLNEFRDTPTSKVWCRLRGHSSYTLPNELGNIESRRLMDAAQKLGLFVSAEPVNRGGYLPVSGDGALIIEDNDLADAVAQKMIAAGVPVEIVHVD